MPYTKVLKKICPMCGESTYLKIEEGTRSEELSAYLQSKERQSIKSALPSFNKFEREFMLTGYCPVCQSKIFCAKMPTDNNFFSFNKNVSKEALRSDVLDSFLAHPTFAWYMSNDNDITGAVADEEIAGILSENEKLALLYEFEALE